MVENDLNQWVGLESNDKLLSKEQTMALYYKAVQGDSYAKEELLMRNMRLIISVARKKCYDGNHLQDVIQEGTIGFLQAIDHFDPTVNDNFSAYAIFWIQKYVYDFLRKDNLIVIPQKVYEQLSKMDELIEANPTLSDEELSQSLSISSKELRQLQQYRYHQVDETDAVEADDHDDLLVRLMIQDLLEQLEPQEKKIVTLYLGLNNNETMTFKEIADKLSISVGSVHNCYNRTLQKLKEQL